MHQLRAGLFSTAVFCASRSPSQFSSPSPPLRSSSLFRSPSPSFYLSIVLSASLLALSSAATAQTTVAGSTSAQFSVSNGGAATYRIPIAVPPGVAGMSPRLELAYSSQGGNGSMGMGWGLSGLSAISRCAKTMANDGVRGNVGFDLNDAYCLNGRRLILVSGTHGAAGAQYRSLQESFSTITAYGSAGNGPAYFIEKSKAGLTTEYGNTADSRIEVQGKPTARTWAQNKVSDVTGNYMSFGYTEDTANGDYNLNRVDYSGNASATPALAPGMSVQLTYESRPDTPTGYHQGSIIKSTQRATNIKTYTGTTLVKDYRLTYEQSSHTQRSRMKTVKECDGSGGCLQAIELQWPAVANGLVTPTAEVIPKTANGMLTGSALPASYRLFADFNGDGKTDYMWWTGGSGWMIVYATETGFTTPAMAIPADISVPGGIRSYPESRIFDQYGNVIEQTAPMIAVGDFNGDGKMDFMWLPLSNSGASGTLGWMVAYSTGNGFTIPTTEVIPKTANGMLTGSALPASYRLFADFNGDGKTDYMWWTGGSGWMIVYATETGFTTPAMAIPADISVPGGIRSYPESRIFDQYGNVIEQTAPMIAVAKLAEGKVF